jgi:subtilase family serine protease
MLGALLALSASSAPRAQTPSGGMVPAWVQQAQKIGPANNDQKVYVTAYLGFRDMAGLKALVSSVSAPGNAQYGHYLKPAEFRAHFAPLPAHVAAVRKSFGQLGLAVEHVPASGFFVQASGTVQQIKTAFHVSQDLYKIHGRILRSNDEAPVLPAAMEGFVTYLGGLHDSMIRPMHTEEGRPAAIGAAPIDTSMPQVRIQPGSWSGAPPRTYCSTYWGGLVGTVTPRVKPFDAKLAWVPCGYSPQQLREGYGESSSFLTTLDGSGVRIAIVDAYASPTIVQDANRYFKNHHVPTLNAGNFSQILPLGIMQVPPDDPCGPHGWFTEETLDVESSHSMAPGANIVYVGASDCNDSLNDAVYDTIDTGVADIVTDSWADTGESGETIYEENVQNAEFMQAAAEGISVLFSSGDDGSNQYINRLDEEGDWPSTSPYVTSVGGTTLGLANATGKKAEWGWGNYTGILYGANLKSSSPITYTSDSGFNYSYGSGGGPSLTQLQPDYQQGVVPSALSMTTYNYQGNPLPFSAAHRVTPDIAMDADPQSGFVMGETFTVIAAGGDPGCTLKSPSTTIEYCEWVEGGTSLASPSFAGVLAIINQRRAANSLSMIGFVNPRLYALTVGAPDSEAAITDVVAPNNLFAVLRAPLDDTVGIRSIDSSPTVVGQGDVSQLATPGYDNMTGLGTPWVPALVTALGSD